MTKSPIQVVLELLIMMIKTTFETFGMVFDKMIELFVSLASIADTGILGLVVASIFGGVMIYLISRFFLKNTKSLIKILLVYVIFVLVLILIFVLRVSTNQTPPL
jgi:uncharacterized membrane-anchored protein